MLGNVIGSKIVELDEIDSTNSYAARMIYDQAPIEGTVITAGYQSAGKGQRGSGWESEKNKNLLISCILFPSFLEVSRHFLLSQAISLSLHEFISSKTSAQVNIKWPNDILANDKKIAGILIENTIRNNKFISSIAGVGINLNQIYFQPHSPEATSLQLLENKPYDLKQCLLELNNCIDKWYTILKSGNYKKITDNYEKVLYRKDEPASYVSNGEEFTARLKGVNASGQLLLEKRNGEEVVFNNKEVKFKF